MRAKLHGIRRHCETVDAAVKKYGVSGEALLPILQEVQKRNGYLGIDAVASVADALNLSDAQTFGVASFYSMLSTEPRTRQVVRVCDGPVCLACGGQDVRRAMDRIVNDGWTVERTSCLGLCDRAPAALIDLEPCGPLSPDKAGTLSGGWRGEAPCYGEAGTGEVRVAMQRMGSVDPNDIHSASAAGAYTALSDALRSQPAKLIETIQHSGLQGLGGAGFPTGRKWQMVAEAAGLLKCIVCNADESEPGAFKDRVLMEGDPHLLLEGMALAAYAVNACEGLIYIRGEYELAARRLEHAIAQAVEQGWLGEDIQGSGFSFQIHLHRGAGAYICGEETALLESLEGRRGEPRLRPPYPTTHGYLGRPTVVNNVETLCKVPAIVARGADWYRSMGTVVSPGTKVFTVSGHVNRPGAFEAPFGITLRDVIEEFAGGMLAGSRFKMALCGGAAGTIVSESLLDVPLDFASQTEGVALGSGVVVVMDESVSAVTLLRWLLHFFEVESCGKCTPCREGTSRARRILERIERGEGGPADCNELERLAQMLQATSLCGLGQSVAWPIQSGLEHFRDDFRERGTS